MKNIFSLAAVLLVAVTMFAQDPIPITCTEALNVMPAQISSETEDIYIVTGYVTNTNGAIYPSRTDASVDQQTFYMDDEPGTKKTFQGYWCNLPSHEALNVGDKITLTGKIINYNNTPEIKNGDVVILERSTAVVDTIEVNVCEALEEGSALNDGDYTDDVFKVYGRIKGTETVNSNGMHTFEMVCGENIFKPYNCKGEEGLELGKGDSVVVIGRLYNYHGTIEISVGTVKLIEKSQQEEVITEVAVIEALTIVSELEKGKSTDARYAITGFVTAIETEYSEQFKNISFFMADDATSEAKDFLAYRVAVSKDDAEKVVVGAKVKVIAYLHHYYKAATEINEETDFAETNAGGTIVILDESAEQYELITEESECSIEYFSKWNKKLHNEIIMLHVPVAPEINGFTFIGWEASGMLEEGIELHAVYEANTPTAAPVVVNPTNKAQKLIRNGNVYILTETKTYTVQGQEVR